MTFDLQTTLLIGGAALLVVLLAWLLLRALTRRQSIAAPPDDGEQGDPYAARRDRPYVRPPPLAAPLVDLPPPGARDIRVDGVPVERSAVPTPAPESVAPEPVAAPPLPLTGDIAGIALPPGATDHADVLTRLKGVGPKLAALLHAEGVTRYEQLASLDEAGLAKLDARLGAFKGRLARDNVPEQARMLASGDTAGFEARFGKLGG